MTIRYNVISSSLRILDYKSGVFSKWVYPSSSVGSMSMTECSICNNFTGGGTPASAGGGFGFGGTASSTPVGTAASAGTGGVGFNLGQQQSVSESLGVNLRKLSLVFI